MSELRLCLVVNPCSGGGATAGRLDSLRRAAAEWFPEHVVRQTEGPGHGTVLAAEAVDEGFELVVAVGGDGTANEVVNGLLVDGAPRREGVSFGVVPAGTGSDLIKSLKMPTNFSEALATLARAEPVASDLCWVRLTDPDSGSECGRVGINVTGFGMAGEVVQRVNAGSKRFGGTATFLAATLRSLGSYRPPQVRVDWTTATGEEGVWRGALTNAFVANGHYCGGGMWVGRGGSMQDGAVELTLIPELSTPRAVLSAPRLFSGTMDRVKGVVQAQITRLRAEAPDGDLVRVDVDGEQPGILPIAIQVLPKVLPIRAGWPLRPILPG